MKEYYPLIHLLTGPPPLDRNGGIWRVIKKDYAKMFNYQRFLVPAFHFTTYNLSVKSFNEWMDDDSKILKNEINKFFPNVSIFVDSGGYQLLYPDKIDLSKWNVKINSKEIFNLQLKYGATKLCNLDIPINPYASTENFKQVINKNIENIKELLENKLPDKKEIYFVVHGRNDKEIKYSYQKIKEIVDFGNEDFNLALGSQVPLLKLNQKIVIKNANTFIKIIKEDFRYSKKVHLFGLGSNIINNIEDSIDYSYDNSTPVRNAMYLKWYDPIKNKYTSFNPMDLKKCECYACNKLKEFKSSEIINILIKNEKVNGLNRSDILGYIALHNIFWEDKRVYSKYNTNFLKEINLPQNLEYNLNNQEYYFPLHNFKPRSKVVIYLKCTSFKPYSKSITHKKIKKFLEKNFGWKEGINYDIITISGLYGPVHWEDERNPIILSYDFRLSNLTNLEHINNLKLKTHEILKVLSKKYEKSYAIFNGVYFKIFSDIFEKNNIKVFKSIEDFNE
jgi:tRNA-guanine family transglycosylase